MALKVELQRHKDTVNGCIVWLQENRICSGDKVNLYTYVLCDWTCSPTERPTGPWCWKTSTLSSKRPPSNVTPAHITSTGVRISFNIGWLITAVFQSQVKRGKMRLRCSSRSSGAASVGFRYGQWSMTYGGFYFYNVWLQILPPFWQSYCIIVLHLVIKETCAHYMYLNLLGARW